MTVEPIELREYASVTVALSTEAARSLARAAPEALTVTPGAGPGQWTITAKEHVGTLNLAGQRILIRPKIDLANLFTLLDLGIPSDAWRDAEFAYRSRPDLLQAFVSLFARSLEQLTARDLHRSYQRREERLLALRGRIDFPAQIKRPSLPAPIACAFDEYTLDIPENRYLLGVADWLLRFGAVPPTTRTMLLHASSRFEDVTPQLPRRSDLQALHLTRLNDHYRPILDLAGLVVENLTISDEVGEHAASSFLLNMNKVFEGFVTRRLRDALRGRLQVLDQTSRHLGVERKVPIRPDLEFRRGDKTVFVGDVKYKLTASGQARSHDYFQLLAYCTALGLRQGMLIYAQVDGDDPEREIQVVNSGHRLTTYRLNLSGGLTDIEAAISQLARWIEDRAVPRPAHSVDQLEQSGTRNRQAGEPTEAG